MTTNDLIDYYVNLLIIQYAQKPKARATIAALVTPVIMDQLAVQIQNAFDPETAIGVQLDTIGKYVGVIRYGQGITNPITLDDDDFRSLIKIAIIKNNSTSDLYTIDLLLDTWFKDLIFAFDFTDMRMSYYLSPLIGSKDLAQIFIDQDMLPRPMGVQLASVIYSPNIKKFFGFRTYALEAVNATPLNSYTDYNMDFPWLSYTDALTV